MHPVVQPLRVAWFSAGVSSAVAVKLALGEIDRIIYTHIEDQHEDTLRFLRDCEEWFNRPIEILRSPYKTVENAILNAGGRGYINGPHGAACTRILKKRVRQEWEMEQGGIPLVYFWGMDAAEAKRAQRLVQSMPKQSHREPLIERGICKEEAHQMLKAAGIKRPAMYELGYRNNNCIGCVKGGASYFNRIRVTHPKVFAERAALERRVGAACMKRNKKPLWLDELDPKAGRNQPPICGECGIMCELMSDRLNPSRQDQAARKEP